jgi:hypothetical protein
LTGHACVVSSSLRREKVRAFCFQQLVNTGRLFQSVGSRRFNAVVADYPALHLLHLNDTDTSQGTEHWVAGMLVQSTELVGFSD